MSLVLAATAALSACGSGNSNSSSQTLTTLAGNWQFTMAAPADGSFSGGIQGGFLSQASNSVTGAVAYSVALPTNPNPIVCNSGSAAITGTLSGQTVTLTAAAGTQTFTLVGTLSLDGSTMVGTYSSTAGTAVDGTVCGTVQSDLQWNATLVPTLTGPLQGIFHSAGGPAGLNEQEFLVLGTLTQGPNSGADNATVTGNVSFVNPITNVNAYPCFAFANVTGQISGNAITLQLTEPDGTVVGQIGPTQGSTLNAVTLNKTQGGYALQSLAGSGYAAYTSACGGGSLQSPADSGSVCLGLNNTTACQQQVSLTPAAISFASEGVGSSPVTQTITLTNTASTQVVGVTVTLTNPGGVSNFTESDTCGVNGATSQGQSFTLLTQQVCVVTIAFTPLETCAAGTSASKCLTATLVVAIPDDDVILTAPITGGVAASATLAHKLNVGGNGVGEIEDLFQSHRFSDQRELRAQMLSSPKRSSFQDADYAEVE